MLHGDPPVTGKGVVIYLYIKVRSTGGKGSNPPAGHILKDVYKRQQHAFSRFDQPYKSTTTQYASPVAAGIPPGESRDSRFKTRVHAHAFSEHSSKAVLNLIL
jgi:hypothetical protein